MESSLCGSLARAVSRRLHNQSSTDRPPPKAAKGAAGAPGPAGALTVPPCRVLWAILGTWEDRMGALDQIEPIEKASRDELAALQLARLKHTVRLAYERMPHYKRKFDAAAVHPDDLKELGDIAKFPLTSKDDLRQNYPFGMFAVPMQDIVRVHASSGTTGKPTVVGYTRKDIDTWTGVMA